MASCLATLAVAVSLPLSVRAMLGAWWIASNATSMRECVLLRGSRAIRSIGWDEGGRFEIWTRSGTRQPACLGRASFRLGRGCLLLRFTTAEGPRRVIIDGAIQDRIAFCRLTRRLARGMLIPSGPKV